jgi:hypothetical protein
MVVATYNCFALPIEIAFEPPLLQSAGFQAINGLCDLIFFMDMIIVFRTIIFVEDKESNDCGTIAASYMRGRFTIDFLSTMPFDAFLSIFLDEALAKNFKLFALFKLIRMLRLSHIISVMNAHKETKLMFKLFKLFFFLLMYIHCLGCVWWFLVKMDGVWIHPMNSIN